MVQVSIFDFIDNPLKAYEITKPIRLIELFAGIGSQAKALERLGADFEHYRVIEFDKYAVASYNAIHHTDFEPMDVTKIKGSDLGIVDCDKYTYLLTYSYPCQDLSVAGKQRGMSKGGGTRSGLLWEVERILNECDKLPEVLLMENVPQVHGVKFINDFEKWCKFLESKGYTNFWQDMNAKDYGVAQSRNRTFMISILQQNVIYEFPEPIPLDKKICDYLDEKVDKKFYVENEKTQKLIADLVNSDTILDRQTDRQTDKTMSGFRCRRSERHSLSNGWNTALPECNTVQRCNEDIGIKKIGRCGMGKYYMEQVIVASRGRSPQNPSDRTKGIPLEQRLEIREGGITNTITSVQKDNLVMEKETVLIKQATKSGMIECEVGGVADLSFPDSATRRGRVIDKGNTSPTLQTDGEICRIEKDEQVRTKYRIRKLTAKECYRLMDFDDNDFFAAESVNSDTQLYKQAGNSIVVSCLCAIFSQLGIKGITPWNEMSMEQKRELSKVNKVDNTSYERNPL